MLTMQITVFCVNFGTIPQYIYDIIQQSIEIIK